VFGVVEAAATLVGAVLGPLLAQRAGLGVAVNTAALLAVAGAALTAVIVPSSDPPDPSGDARLDPRGRYSATHNIREWKRWTTERHDADAGG